MNTLERLRIYVDESDRWHGKLLYQALVTEAKQRGIAGATVMRGVAGFGQRSHHALSTDQVMELSLNLPIVVTILDRAEAIAQFLPVVQAMATNGIIAHDTVKVVHHASVA